MKRRDEEGSSNSLVSRGLDDKEAASPFRTPRLSAVGAWSSFDALNDEDAGGDAARNFPLSDDFMSKMIICHASR